MIQIGSKLHNSYRIVGQLGEGGMGRTFLAEDENLDTALAVKTLRAELMGDEVVVRRFTREIWVMANLSHPNVVKILTCDAETEEPWIAMEYCPRSLDDNTAD